MEIWYCVIRNFAGDIPVSAEAFDEITCRGKAHARGDIINPQLRIAQQLRGVNDSHAGEIFVKEHAGFPLEQMPQICRVHTALAAKLADGYARRIGAADRLHRQPNGGIERSEGRVGRLAGNEQQLLQRFTESLRLSCAL